MFSNLWGEIIRAAPASWQAFLSGHGFRRYFFNTGWMLSGQAFSLIVAFLIGTWVARYLGPADYGVFSYSLSFAGLFSMIAGLGTDGILARELVRQPENRRALLGSGLAIKIASGLLAWLAATLVAWLLMPTGLERLLVSLIALSYVFVSFNIIDTFFRSRVESRYSVQAQMISVLVGAILKAVVILSGGGLVWLAVIYTAEIFLQGLMLLAMYRKRRLEIGPWQLETRTMKKLLGASWPLLFSGLSSFLLLRIDQVMIGSYLSVADVGLYAAAVKLSEVWYFIPGIICASLFPAIINAREAGDALYRRRIGQLYSLLLMLAILIASFIYLGSSQLVRLLFGTAYLAAVPVAAAYAWSTIGWFLVSVLWYKFMAEGRLALVFWSSFLPMVANILLNIWLIPRYGIMGAAWSTLASYSLLAAFVFYPDHKSVSSGRPDIQVKIP